MSLPDQPPADAPRIQVLIVDDEREVRRLLRNCLQRLGCSVLEASSGEQGLLRLETEPCDIAMVDLRMPPGIDGLEVTRRAKRLRPDLHVVLVTGYATIEVAVHALHQGADDFLPKPFRIEQLRVILDRQLETIRRRREARPFDREGAEDGPLPGLVGTSPAMEAVYRAVRRVAPSDETVLIQGESGTGKELAARAIHFWSRRHRKPFVCVNCASLTDTILENELFGHEAESFTGAVGQRKGLIEEAHGGTVFLDEIGDASPSLQMGLLRVLQEGEVRRVGSAEAIPVDVRVVTASNKNLELEIAEGRFRKDLYYRISVVPIEMPSLRERPGDVPLLIDHFLRRFGEGGRSIADDAVRALQRNSWPGNVRELENLIRRLLVLVPDSVIGLEQLPARYRESAASRALAAGSFREAKEVFERQFIEALLQRVRGNVAEAARQAGLGRPYLHEKLRKFHIDPGLFRDSGGAVPPMA